MLEIYINDKEVGISNDYGPWYTDKLNNQWLWLLNAIKNGTKIKVADNREKLQPHQVNMDYVRGVTKTNHMMLKELLEIYHPKTKGILSDNECATIEVFLCLKNRTVIDLRNLRDFVVASMGRSDDIEDWDRMSAITHCIDMELVNRGAEV